MTVAKPVTNPEQDLAIREMILGVLKAKDSTGRNIIHSSDFRTAITDLGFPMGSTVIENILVFCKIDNRGNLDFTQLEKELTRERRVFNSQKKIEKPMLSTSTGVVSKPWRGDEFHRAKVASEQQLNKITEHNPVVHEIYDELSHHRMNPSDAISQLEALEIYPTKEFMKLLQIMTFNDVSFAQFIKALTKSDPHSQDLDDLNIPAGNRKPKPADTTDIIGLQRKRSTSGMKTAFHESADLEVVQKPIRKMVKDGAVNDATIFKAEQIKKTLFCDSEPVSLLSHNQQDMVAGTLGTKDVNVAFNVEAKVQREQVLAALRKLDVGAISMDDFQDMLFSIGVDLPEALAVDIRRSVVSGRMDVKKYVKLLDASIFKHAAIEERVTQNEVENIKERYVRAVSCHGLDAFLDLSQCFRDLDQDSDGRLTFSEFKMGCEALNLTLNETELRLLFHSFDKNGDGVLQYEEFLDSIRGSFSAVRATWIRRAFQKLDRHGQGSVLVDVVADSFNPQGHPSVVNGSKAAREVASDFVRWFTNEPGFDGTVKYPRFEKYFSNISANLRSDEEFILMVKTCWQLSDYAPPPPVYKLRHKIGGNTDESFETPAGIQSHGDCITWNQEHSMLEKNAMEKQAKTGKKRIPVSIERNAKTDVINWEKYGSGENPSDPAGNELRESGVSRIGTGKKNESKKSLLAWSLNKPASQQTSIKQDSTVNNTSANTIFKLQYQDEQKVAGVPAFRNMNQNVPTTPTKLDEYKLNIPYGVDRIPEPKQTSSSTPKSLSDVLREKQAAKPLINYIKK